MSSTATSLRIGDVADAVGLTPRTIRYYEELGLLDTGERGERAKGSHRQFTEADIERLRELVRLRDLLGLSLEALTELAETTDVSRWLRSQWAASTGDAERLRIVRAAIPNVRRQLELVHARQRNLAEFETELVEKLDRMRGLLTELEPR